jgi:hypothetical protein
MADILNGKRFIAAKLGIVWFSGFTEELNVTNYDVQRMQCDGKSS